MRRPLDPGEGDRIVIEKYWGHGDKDAKGKAKREGYWMARLGQRDGTWSLTDPLLVPGYEKRPGGPPAGPVFHQGRLYGDLQGFKVVDPSGTVLSETTARGFRSAQSSPILAGSHLIQVGHSERYHRPYPDQKMYADFLVVDVSDPSKMTVTSMYNMLGGVNVPHVPCIDKYLPHWIDRSDPTRCRFGNYAVPPQFGGYNAGLFASGNRLLILGMAHLYCIGDPSQPYNWNPASRPAEIRAMLD